MTVIPPASITILVNAMKKLQYTSMFGENLVQSDFPNLAHYTTETGLRGIIDNGTLYATRYDNLRDKKEILFFRDHLHEALLHMMRQVRAYTFKTQWRNINHRMSDEFVDVMIAEFYKSIFSIDAGYAVPYITSFYGLREGSGQKDWNSPYHWKEFGENEPNNPPYAIIFDTAKLIDRLNMEATQFAYMSVQPCDVIYEKDGEFDKQFNPLLNLIMDLVFSPVGKNTDDTLIKLFEPFVLSATRYKSSGYLHEGEVRFVCCPLKKGHFKTLHRELKEVRSMLQKEEIANINANRIMLFENAGQKRLPIKSIVVGPHEHQTERIKELETKYNYPIISAN